MKRRDKDAARAAIVDGILRRSGYDEERIKGIPIPGDDDTPKDLRFQERQFRLRRWRGRTVNAGALDRRKSSEEFPGDASWLQSQAENHSALHFVATDKAKGNDSAGVQRGGGEDGLSAILRNVPKSLLRNAGERSLPDWEKIFDGAALRRTRSTPIRAYVAERRWRENATRDELLQEALTKAKGKGPYIAQAYFREVGAAWRYLDLPSTQERIAAFIRGEKHKENLAAAQAALSLPEGSKSAATLRATAAERMAERMAEQRAQQEKAARLDFAGPPFGSPYRPKEPEERPRMIPPLPRDVGTGRPRGWKPAYSLPRRAEYECKNCGRRFMHPPKKCPGTGCLNKHGQKNRVFRLIKQPSQMIPPLPRDVRTGRPRRRKPPYSLSQRAKYECKKCGRRFMRLPKECPGTGCLNKHGQKNRVFRAIEQP
jgi:ribosomal protein L37AE/L43A